MLVNVIANIRRVCRRQMITNLNAKVKNKYICVETTYFLGPELDESFSIQTFTMISSTSAAKNRQASQKEVIKEQMPFPVVCQQTCTITRCSAQKPLNAFLTGFP